MPLQITLDIFSGRPNPTIRLSGRPADDLLERLRPGKALPRSEAGPPPVLGYRGLVIEQTGRPSRALPRRFVAAAGRVYVEGAAYHAADPEFDEALLGSATLVRRLGVKGLTPALLRDQVRRRRRLFEIWEPIKLFPKKPKCPCAPIYEPAWWNDGGQRQGNNNCYNYGCNYRTDTFAQPGKASGAMYPLPIAGPGVLNGAVHDDLIDWPGAKNKCPKAGHLVALVIWPSVDFHWYRKGLNGRWTHKPGGTQATNLDNSGALITDPRTADRGSYTQFNTFMIVKHGHIKIK